jgi:hypothetical protein
MLVQTGILGRTPPEAFLSLIPSVFSVSSSLIIFLYTIYRVISLPSESYYYLTEQDNGKYRSNYLKAHRSKVDTTEGIRGCQA